MKKVVVLFTKRDSSGFRYLVLAGKNSSFPEMALTEHASFPEGFGRLLAQIGAPFGLLKEANVFHPTSSGVPDVNTKVLWVDTNTSGKIDLISTGMPVWMRVPDFKKNLHLAPVVEGFATWQYELALKSGHH